MKAANGGMLHTLCDYSHPHLLGGLPHRRYGSWPRTRLTRPPTLRQPQTQPTRRDEPHAPSALRNHELQGAASFAVSSSSHHNSGSLGRDRRTLRRALGRRLPRCLVVHGTADATVPFSQTAAVASALRVLGVPTTVRFDPGGE